MGEQEVRSALNELYAIACCVHSELGKMVPSGMAGQERLMVMREKLLEKIGQAEKALTK